MNTRALLVSSIDEENGDEWTKMIPWRLAMAGNDVSRKQSPTATPLPMSQPNNRFTAAKPGLEFGREGLACEYIIKTLF